MKRRMLILLTIAFTILVMAIPTHAIGKRDEVNNNIDQVGYKPLKIYALDLYKDGFGLKEVIGYGEPGWHLTLNAQGSSANDIELQVGSIYRIPASLLVWRFYGGGGLEYRQKDRSVAPYVLVGSEFVGFFFVEQGFTLEEDGRRFTRNGIRFRF